MKLFNDRPEYVRLDDDVSFQIVRTDPKLTTNTKLMYDGENLYMESYDAAPLLSTTRYKNYKIYKTGYFNRDIRNFLLGTNSSAYSLGRYVEDTIIPNNFDHQFENMYWCGVESINSDIYPQEMGCIAPLYIRKKRPNYFVIFRIDRPSNMNSTVKVQDYEYDFKKDILKHAKIIKAFDLRENTPIGMYIKKYVEQRDFKYDQSIYVNFSSNKIYYYGIDKNYGVLTQKVENFEEQLLNNDNTIMRVDDWITGGFERNNLIFPYILNLEFLFDDKQTEEYHFARYFGMYCNDIDLYDLDVIDCIPNKAYNTTIIKTKYGEEDDIVMDENCLYYIKDKFKEIYTLDNTVFQNLLTIPGDIKKDGFCGFENSSISTYVEKLPGVGNAVIMFRVDSNFAKSGKVIIKKPNRDTITTFTSADTVPEGQFSENNFSCLGGTTKIAGALAALIRNYNGNELKWVTAYNIDNVVVIKAIYPGAHMNDLFYIDFDTLLKDCVTVFNSSLAGGSDFGGCRFKVYTSDKDMFVDKSGRDRDPDRYFKCGLGMDNAKITAFIPYINEYGKIDDTYSVVTTDSNGRFVSVSKTDQVEIVDRYYAKVGVLSFFPVKDFDFDTVSSAYGEYTVLKEEMEYMKNKLEENYNDEILTPPYSRFFDDNTDKIKTEYEYYCENVLPELTLVNKTAPYIAKWSYMDGAKDSCENPYRLNTSKIFETCNFSANTFVKKADILEYTHSMPYYIKDANPDREESINEYQYLPMNTIWESGIDRIIEYFSAKKTGDPETDVDPFMEIFGDLTVFEKKNKRFGKRYSRFLLGNGNIKSSTLFRGVKFEITELQNGKEVNTGKYNDYRFAFVYIPVYHMFKWKKDDDKPDDFHTVYFIKNDDYKFIVGLVLFETKHEEKSKFEFDKAFVYSGSMGFLNMVEDETPTPTPGPDDDEDDGGDDGGNEDDGGDEDGGDERE